MFTANELMTRALPAGNPFTVTTDAGSVLVTPCIERDRQGNTYVAYWLMDAEGVNLCGEDTAERAADTLNRLAELKAESADEEVRLRQFYDEHIAGKSYHGLDSYELYKFGQAEWDKALKAGNAAKYLYDFTNTDAFRKAAAERFHSTPEHVGEALALSESWDVYSDWHKDVYGYRPR